MKTIHLSPFFFLAMIILLSCNRDNKKIEDPIDNPEITDTIMAIRAVDISSFPMIEESNPVFYNSDGQEEAFLSILKNSGVNTIRLRLWVNPTVGHSGFNEVKLFSATLKSMGFKIWLSVHYSDTWADPAHQSTPAQWANLSFDALKDSVYSYTSRVVNEMNPDYIQIGNEINSGFLFPSGKISDQPQQFKDLLSSGIQAVRDHSNQTKIMIHFAGIENADWFYAQIANLNYDIIGLSYYPLWHGKDLNLLKSLIENLSTKYNKDIVIAETAYPFTLGYNDWTNNIVGSENQLILPDYPATEQGQKDFVNEIKTIISENGIGFCYWGAELIAWDGAQSTNGSPWENQALFDFQNHALPALLEFKNK